MRHLVVAVSGALAVACASAAAGVDAASQSGSQPAAPSTVRMTGHALADLRQGGLVVVMTHGPTAPDEQDDTTAAPDDCAAQRGLSDTARLMASGVGRFFSRQGIRVGVVLSSRYCRGVETAERIAQPTRASKVRRMDDLGDAAQAPADDRARRSAALKRLAATPPGTAGTNTVIVTHAANVGDVLGSGTAPARDGELFVLRPSRDAQGRATYRLVHRLRVEDLSAYAKATRS